MAGILASSAFRRQEDQSFRAILGYIASQSLAWARRDFISKIKTKKRNKRGGYRVKEEKGKKGHMEGGRVAQS